MNNSEENLIQFMQANKEELIKVKVFKLNGQEVEVEDNPEVITLKACSVEINHKIKEMIYTVESPNFIF